MFSNYLSRDFLRTLKDCGITSGLIDWWVYVCSCAVSHHFPDSQFCPLSVFANHASFFHRSLRIIFSGHADSSCLLFPFGFDSSFVMVVHVIYGKWKGMKYHNCSSVGQISVDNFLHLGWQQRRRRSTSTTDQCRSSILCLPEAEEVKWDVMIVSCYPTVLCYFGCTGQVMWTTIIDSN